jgi:hypothetical protein
MGENGHVLSEYLQLIWLYRNIDVIAKNYEYLRIFHYRRFISTKLYENAHKADNSPWTQIISQNFLGDCYFDFTRQVSDELYNTRVKFNYGLLRLYSETHVMEDLLNFTSFLLERDIFNKDSALDFLTSEYLIPACNTGTFKVINYKIMFSVLSVAAEFLYSPKFKLRDGYQRRSVGFLLERLHSYLILKFMNEHRVNSNFGVNYLISENASSTVTSERIE